MRISDWSSDVCSSDLPHRGACLAVLARQRVARNGACDQALQQRALGAHRCRHEPASASVFLVHRWWAGRHAGSSMPGIGRLSATPFTVVSRLQPPAAPRTTPVAPQHATICGAAASKVRSEEHTSELQSLMRISYAVFCLKKTKPKNNQHIDTYALSN